MCLNRNDVETQGLSNQNWTIRIINRAFGIPLDAPVHRPITRVFIVDGTKNAEDINVTLTRNQFDVMGVKDAHDFFELILLGNSRKNLQFELQLKKPLIDSFKTHDQVR